MSYEKVYIFHFSCGGFFGPKRVYRIEAEKKEKCRLVAYGRCGSKLQWEWNVELDIKSLEILDDAVAPAREWLDNYSCEEPIFDGWEFTLEVHRDDYSICTYGYEKKPDNYEEVEQRIVNALEKLYKLGECVGK